MMSESDPAKISEFASARRESWLLFAIMALGILAVAAVTILLTNAHVGIAANLLVSILCLIPLLLLMAPLVIGVFAGNWALTRADKAAVSQLLKLERQTAEVRHATQDAGRSAGKRIIGLAAAVERLAPLWDIFDREAKERDHVANPSKPD